VMDPDDLLSHRQRAGNVDVAALSATT
jgi:hypothetical protein